MAVDISTLVTLLSKTIALAIATGNAFLPDPAAYDDLIYKLVENSSILARFQKAYDVPAVSSSSQSAQTSSPVSILINVSSHYHVILEAEKQRGKMSKNVSPREVSKIIRQGYETLDVPRTEGLDAWDKWREGEERGLLKKAARVAVDDTRRVLRGL